MYTHSLPHKNNFEEQKISTYLNCDFHHVSKCASSRPKVNIDNANWIISFKPFGEIWISIVQIDFFPTYIKSKSNCTHLWLTKEITSSLKHPLRDKISTKTRISEVEEKLVVFILHPHFRCGHKCYHKLDLETLLILLFSLYCHYLLHFFKFLFRFLLFTNSSWIIRKISDSQTTKVSALLNANIELIPCVRAVLKTPCSIFFNLKIKKKHTVF